MKTFAVLASILVVATLCSAQAQAQETAAPSKIEVGLQFSSLTFPDQSFPGAATFGRGSTEAGFGGKFTFNLNQHIAFEAEGNFFPHENFNDSLRSGRLLQGQFGLKAGKRFGKFGVFAKARPGFASFSKVLSQVGTQTITDSSGQPITFPIFGQKRKTRFSMDIGGVLEFYPTRKVLTRLDVGDTIIHYSAESFFSSGFAPVPTSRTVHNLQVSAGIGFRFGSLQPEEAASQNHTDGVKRFELGAQFSSLTLQQLERYPDFSGTTFLEFRDTITQAGFGGRLTYNLTPSFALEFQGDFYPKELPFVNNGRSGGHILQGQGGVKAGKRLEKFGIFAKARPGIVSFSKTIEFTGLDPVFGFPILRAVRKSYFSMDLGGVLEFYPSRRIVTRFDGGDTIIRYRAIDYPFIFFPTLQNFHTPARTMHNFQFSAGVGFRF